MPTTAPSGNLQVSLPEVGARPPLRRYLQQSWGYRTFGLTMALYKVEAQNARQRLGQLWILLKPVLDALVYGFIFGVIMGHNRPANYIGFLVVGVFMFSYFGDAMNRGARSITSNGDLVRSIRFPRILLPMMELTRVFLNFLPVLGVLAIVLLATSNWPTAGWLLVPVFMALFTMFNFGIACVFARWNAFSRDVQEMVPYISRLLFYTSGVFYNIDKVLAPYPVARNIMEWTPVQAFISVARGLMLRGYTPTAQQWTVCTVWALGLLIVGVIHFWRADEKYGQCI